MFTAIIELEVGAPVRGEKTWDGLPRLTILISAHSYRKTMIHIFYHSADLDGKCSGAIAHRKFPEAKLHPINYGDSFPWHEMGSDDTVYMLDFTLQPYEDMIQLDALCDLIVIDHHGSAIEAFKELGYQPPGIMRDGTAACILTHKYLYPDHPIPYYVHLLGSWDTWDHSDPKCEPFQMGMRGLPNNPESGLWDDLNQHEHRFMSKIIEAGEIIVVHEKNNTYNKMKGLAYEKEVMIKGKRYSAIVANMPFGGSKCFDRYFNPDLHDLMITFYRHPQGIWSIGLYTNEDGLNVADICKSMGGGGHPNAGGFQMLTIDWLLS